MKDFFLFQLLEQEMNHFSYDIFCNVFFSPFLFEMKMIYAFVVQKVIHIVLLHNHIRNTHSQCLGTQFNSCCICGIAFPCLPFHSSSRSTDFLILHFLNGRIYGKNVCWKFLRNFLFHFLLLSGINAWHPRLIYILIYKIQRS